ncbi:hypothetical protein BgiBS90_019432, partial [Biomphalaria glabrata]
KKCLESFVFRNGQLNVQCLLNANHLANNASGMQTIEATPLLCAFNFLTHRFHRDSLLLSCRFCSTL